MRIAFPPNRYAERSIEAGIGRRNAHAMAWFVFLVITLAGFLIALVGVVLVPDRGDRILGCGILITSVLAVLWPWIDVRKTKVNTIERTTLATAGLTAAVFILTGKGTIAIFILDGIASAAAVKILAGRRA